MTETKSKFPRETYLNTLTELQEKKAQLPLGRYKIHYPCIDIILRYNHQGQKEFFWPDKDNKTNFSISEQAEQIALKKVYKSISKNVYHWEKHVKIVRKTEEFILQSTSHMDEIMAKITGMMTIAPVPVETVLSAELLPRDDEKLSVNFTYHREKIAGLTNPRVLTSITSEQKMWTIPDDPANKHHVIQGRMQSQKTIKTINMAIQLLTYKMSTIIVVENRLAMLEQVVARVRHALEQYVAFMAEQGLKKDLDDMLKVLDISRGKTTSREEFRDAMTGRQPKIFVALRSQYDLQPVNDIIDSLTTKRYVVILDEADANDSNGDSSAQQELTRLEENSLKIFNVTATPLTCIMDIDKRISAGNVIVLPRPEFYKDLPNFTFKTLTKTAKSCDNNQDDPFVIDENIADYIDDFIRTQPYTCSFWNNQKHPVMTLIRNGLAIKCQQQTANYILEKYPDKTVVITYNSGGNSLGGITMGGCNLPKYSIVLDDGTRSVYKKGLHTFSSCHIGQLIQYLQDKGGVELFPRIVICAGKMADRGISFCSANYTERLSSGKIPWHLTEMYFIPSANTIQPNLLQIAGRLCGVNRDDIPLTLYSNSTEDILKAYHAQEELIDRAKKEGIKARLKNPGTENVDLMSALVLRQKMARKKCSKRRFTHKTVPCRITKVVDDKPHGGWDWSRQGRSYTGETACFGSGDRTEEKIPVDWENKNEVHSEDDADDEKWTGDVKVDDPAYYPDIVGMEKIKEHYRDKNGNIYKIIQLFRKVNNRSLSLRQLREMTEVPGLTTNNHTTIDHTKGKYVLITAISSGMYKLHPGVIKFLGLNLPY